MAPSKQKKKNGKPKQKRQVRRIGDPRATALARLIADPCGASIVEGVLPGERGFTGRFACDISANTTAGYTAGAFIYHPGSGTMATLGAATSSASVTVTYGWVGAASPGYTFITANAAKVRSLAACIQAFPSAVSVTNITGEYAVGHCSLNTLPNAASTTIDQIFTMASSRGAVERKTVDVKWRPGNEDVRYVSPGSLTGVDDTDSNVVFLAYRGYPAATALSVRFINVVEWTPVRSLGTSISAGNNPNPLNPATIVAKLDAAAPGWVSSLAQQASADVAGAMRYGVKTALSFGAKALAAAIL